MSKVNFIKSVSPQRQEALNRWAQLSVLLGSILLFLLLAATLFKAHQLYSIKRQHQSAQQSITTLETDLKKQTAIKKEHTKLAKHETKVSNLKNNPKTPSAYLKELSALIPTDVSLTDYKQLPNKTVELNGIAKRTNAATSFLTALNQSLYFENMQLVSLQSTTQENDNVALMQFKITGKIAQ